MEPPRSLWVPFDLGRPLGSPDDPEFQHRVLRQLLGLFWHDTGPVLEDFPEDAPEAALEGWTCPIPQAPSNAITDGPLGALRQELNHLAPWYEARRRHGGRTTVGASGEAIEQSLARLARALETDLQALDEVRALKLAVEDLKAYYLEAAVERPDQVSRRDSADWLWQGTRLGESLKALSARLVQHPDPRIQEFAMRTLVPRDQMDE